MNLFLVWSVMIAGEWVISALALRNCRKTYPWFTALVCAMAFKSVYLFYVRATDVEHYFYPYYRTEFAVNFLMLGATVEVFGTLFRPFWTVPKSSLVTLTLSTSVTLVTVAHANARLSEGGEIAFYQSMDRVVSCSIGITLAAAMLFARHFDMPFRSRIKGIASGLYIMSVTSVCMSFVTSHLNRELISALAFLPVVAHYATLSLWIYYVSRKEALVAVVGRSELVEVRKLLNQFKLALSYTTTSCGLTQRKAMGIVSGEEKAKMVNKR